MNTETLIEQIKTEIAYEEGCLAQYIAGTTYTASGWDIDKQKAYILGLVRCLEIAKDY